MQSLDTGIARTIGPGSDFRQVRVDLDRLVLFATPFCFLLAPAQHLRPGLGSAGATCFSSVVGSGRWILELGFGRRLRQEGTSGSENTNSHRHRRN